MGEDRRAVLYARKSKYSGEGQSKSVTDQLDDCRAYAEARGWQVVAELMDDGKSGSTLPWSKRTEFARAVEMFEAGEADTFVTLWTSRLSRDEQDRRALPHMLGTLGVEWHAVDDGGLIETETYDGFTRDTVRYLIDVGESKRKSEMWKATHRRRQEAGLPKNGLPRFGYKKDGKGYVPDPDVAPLLAEAYRRYAGGAGFGLLATEFNERGILTTRGTAWSTQSLVRSMDSGFAAGLLVQDTRTTKKDKKEYLPGSHPAIITEAEWQAYVDAREGRRMLPTKRRTAKWFLAGLAVCGSCGGRVIITTHSPTKSQALCSAYHNKKTCSGVWIKRQTLEHRVAIWLGGHLEDLPERDHVAPDAENVVRSLEVDLEGVVEALGRLALGFAEGTIDLDGYRLAQKSLTERRETVERELRAAREEAARVAPINRDVYARLESAGAESAWEWNALLGKVLRRVEVYRDRLVFVPVVGEPVTINR